MVFWVVCFGVKKVVDVKILRRICYVLCGLLLTKIAGIGDIFDSVLTFCCELLFFVNQYIVVDLDVFLVNPHVLRNGPACDDSALRITSDKRGIQNS